MGPQYNLSLFFNSMVSLPSAYPFLATTLSLRPDRSQLMKAIHALSRDPRLNFSPAAGDPKAFCRDPNDYW